MSKSLKHIAPLLIVLFTVACAKDPTLDIRTSENFDFSETVSVIDHYPADRAMNISTRDPIVVQFSAPITTGSVDSFAFRIQDESGVPVEGTISFNSTEDEIIFERKMNGVAAAL